MTNAYFDQANPPKYRGTFRVCGQCFTVVAASYWEKHVARCNELEDLIEHPATLEIDDITEPGSDGYAAFRAEAEQAMTDAISKRVDDATEGGGL